MMRDFVAIEEEQMKHGLDLCWEIEEQEIKLCFYHMKMSNI